MSDNLGLHTRVFCLTRRSLLALGESLVALAQPACKTCVEQEAEDSEGSWKWRLDMVSRWREAPARAGVVGLSRVALRQGRASATRASQSHGVRELGAARC